MSRLKELTDQLSLARMHTWELLEGFAEVDWFRQPHEGITHVAWQVGHLAVAEYHLTLERIWGRRGEDASLLPDDFIPIFGRGTAPVPDSTRYPSPNLIRATLDDVHQRALAELDELSDEFLDSRVDDPHPRFSTRYGALRWCALHEMLHAGQIGLLRRLLGMNPRR